MMMKVRDLITELIKHDMNTEVCISIDEVHQTEHGIAQGYSFDIDSIEYEYGALMIKFKDYRSKKKQVCEEGDKLVEWIKFENRVTELEKTVANIQSVVLDLLKEHEKMILDEAVDGPGKDGNVKESKKKASSRPKKCVVKDGDYPFDPNVIEMGQL